MSDMVPTGSKYTGEDIYSAECTEAERMEELRRQTAILLKRFGVSRVQDIPASHPRDRE